MVFPRILALSEVVWSYPEQRDYKEFASRVEHFNKRLDALNINYANHLYEIKGSMASNNNKPAYQLETASTGKTIRFTLDGSEPTITSDVYNNPILITKNVNLKAGVFNSEEQLGNTFSQDIHFHKALGKKITIDKALNKSYPGSGAAGLVNGISGSDTRYGDKEWLGFSGEDIEITIDLGKETDISSVETRFHNGNGQWIYAPKYLNISYDGNKASNIDIPVSNELLVPIQIMTKRKARIIKLTIPNYGIIPEGRQGAGHKAWTFIDEIIVN
jgi:hexosaminidase